MATREKKPRAANSDSPTPSLGGGSDSAPSTPTSKCKGSRTSLSRQKSKQLQNINEDSAQSTDDINEVAASDPANTSGGSSGKSATNSRATRATKEENSEKTPSSKTRETDKDDSKEAKPPTKKKIPLKKPLARNKAKTTVTALKKTTLLKRKTRPIVGKPVLGKKVRARKQIDAKGKKEVTVTVKDSDSGGKNNTNLRNGKNRASESPVPKRKVVSSKDKEKSPKTEPTTPSKGDTVKPERRRSESISKCSDATETSVKDEDDRVSLPEIKKEILEDTDTKSKILDKMAGTFNECKTPTPVTVKDDKSVRRSSRQRKSTAKDKDDFVTPKIKAPVEIKSEPMDTDETDPAPLTIDTETHPKEVPSSEPEKDSSLSPELVSEGVSEMSVKEFYSEPAFLENNLGIEKDPKLGEIVQGQEKIKLDKCGDSNKAIDSNGSTSVNDPKPEIEPVVIKEEKIDEDIKITKPEEVEVEKLKEIIGIVGGESVAIKNTSILVVTSKEENPCGNESPLSDHSSGKDSITGSKDNSVVINKKLESRSDSDGERPAKQNTPKSKTNIKEPKPTKVRNTKDKSKEDEKLKEEKLRQEKLRVEEKVREEKLRAERLKLEEEKKLHEEKLLQEVKETIEQDVKSLSCDVEGKQECTTSVDEVISVIEKVLPVTTQTTLSLTSADSQLVLSVTSAEKIKIVEQSHTEVSKVEPILTNAVTLENLPAITLLKKDPKQVKDNVKSETVQLKAELEILPLKEAVVAKEEKLKELDSESPLQIISKSENAAAAVTVTTVTAKGSQSPLSIIKIQTDENSVNTATIFKEIPIETRVIQNDDPEAIQNCDPSKQQLDETKTAEISAPSVKEVLSPVVESSTTSPIPTASPPLVLEEPDDITNQKESHLAHLGLITLKAACAEKQRRKELNLLKPVTASGSSGNSGYTSSSSSKSGKSNRSTESTGTLKTVIKLNRGEKRKPRVPLKMTLQKGKGKGAEKDANGGDGNGEASFYIVQNEAEHQNSTQIDAAGSLQDGVSLPEVVAEVAKEVVQKAPLVIPEKASSFNVHPERLCQDQCFYCGGKFGLYDTPCHIAAMKSSERQQNILASEVKIKIDSCLCDACFRHVDRKANCPSYRKKTEAKSLSSLAKIQNSIDDRNQELSEVPNSSSVESLPPSTEDLEIVEEKIQGSCHVLNCGSNASHTIRRKWMLKMKKTINKILEINLEQSNFSTNLIPICDGHYELISHLMICAMCKRRLPKNHIYYIVNEIPQLERLIQEQGIAMKLGNSTLVVCKLCRYYANLLLKPPDAKSQKAQFIKNYNRRLLQFYERENEQQDSSSDGGIGGNKNTQEHITRIVTQPDIVISDGEEDETSNFVESGMVGESVSLQRRSVQQKPSSRNNTSPEIEEVTITPTPKVVPVGPSANVSGNSSIVLDTDVSIEIAGSAEKRRKDESIDMARALKANPNISMRELFPG
ncbi:titin homolog, partial [Uranotaenia lowii]|uniref:titin homolog n=1 Tax=Uranotaenia lowii TaxID=190385 RepID=UPI00247AD509